MKPLKLFSFRNKAYYLVIQCANFWLQITENFDDRRLKIDFNFYYPKIESIAIIRTQIAQIETPIDPDDIPF
jgi:hypothetical protein